MSGDGLKGSDYAFRPAPEWLPKPLKRVVEDLTYNEVHAMELGLIGILAAVGWHYGLTMEVGTFSLAAIGMAFGLRKLPESLPVASRVIRREPWYFTTVYVVSAVLTSGVMETLGSTL